MELSLYEINASELKPILRKNGKLKDAELSPGCCFWLGSVNLQDKEQLENFLSCFNSGDLEKLKGFSEIGGDLVYAILVRKFNRENEEYYLIAIQLNQGIALPEIISIKTLNDVKVIGVKPKEVELDYLPKNFFFEIIKHIFRW
jgi:hypothetical protein